MHLVIHFVHSLIARMRSLLNSSRAQSEWSAGKPAVLGPIFALLDRTSALLCGTLSFLYSRVRSSRAQSEWSMVYLLLVLIIAALVLISVVKPMFQQSQDVASQTVKQVQGP